MVPSSLRAQWIWLTPTEQQVEEHLFFRREFSLAEMPGSAELWTTARTGFQVYINDRHVAFGPDPCPSARGSFLSPVEASFYLQTGRNVIAVLASNTGVTRTSCNRFPGGLWCQLDVEGKPLVWTNEEWKVLRGACYAGNRPRRSASSGFTESVDFRVYPHGWSGESFNDQSWTAPNWVKPVSLNSRRILPSRIPEVVSAYDSAKRICSRGKWRQKSAVSFLSLSELVGSADGGVYVARSFFHASAPGPLPVKIFGDNPYRLFVNGRCVRQQGVPELRCGQSNERINPETHGEAGIIPIDGEIQVRNAWNEVLLFEMTDAAAAGMAFVFPQTRPGGLVFQRAAEEEAERGWSVAGPLKTPLAASGPDIDFERLARHPYTPELSASVNEEALLHALQFQNDAPAEKSAGKCELGRQEYVVYDLGRSVYGVPCLSLTASEADLWHIVTAESLDPVSQVPSLRRGDRQDVETIVCGSGHVEWQAVTPRSFRYLMLVAREVDGQAQLQDAGVCTSDIGFSERGRFESSDEMLTKIWDIGERTLTNTVRGQFMDAPAGREEQALPDAMIQAWSAYHVFGAYDMGASCLGDFAESQYETGEILPVSPSARYIRQLQFSLFWPIWLYQQYLYAGDRDHTGRMLPHLDDFLAFLEAQTGEHHLLAGAGEECTLRNFRDWTGVSPNATSTALNALYCRTLFSSARLLALLGEDAAAQELRSRGTQSAKAIRALCWDGDKEQFADSATEQGAGDSASWVTQVLALYGGVVPSESVSSLFTRFVAEADGAQLGHSPLFKYILLQAAVLAGKRDWAIRHLREYWGGMVAKGADTWWQSYDPAAAAPAGDAPLCYGAAAFPNAFLCSELVGIRPATPGFAAAYFNPLVEPEQQVTARIPTVHGPIDVRWQSANDEVEAHVRASFPLDLIPVFPPELEAKMTLHLSENVSLLVRDDG